MPALPAMHSAPGVEASAEPPSPAPPPRPQRAECRELLGMAALAAVVLSLFYLPVLATPYQLGARDNGRMHAPVKRFVASELAQGRLPEWNPYAGLGTPLVAAAVDGVQHPLNALLLALPVEAAIACWVLVASVLAATGVFTWARQLGATRGGAVVGGLAFALSGPLVSATDNLTFLTAYAALPWMFAAAGAFAAGGGAHRLLGVLAASALCAAAGDPQAWGVALVLAIPYVALVARRSGAGPALRRAGLALAAALAGAAPFVLPVLAWLGHSIRSDGALAADRAMWNLPPARILELAVPGLVRGDPREAVHLAYIALARDGATLPWFASVYLGASVLALAIVGARRRRAALALVLAAGALLWAALGPRGGADRLPLATAFRYAEKLAVWPALLIAVAAALGFGELLARGHRRIALGCGAGAAVLLGAHAALALDAEGWIARAARAGHRLGARPLVENTSSGLLHAGLLLALVALAALLARRAAMARAAPVALGIACVLDLAGGNGFAYVLVPPAETTPPPLATALVRVDPSARVSSPFSMREDRWRELGHFGSAWRWGRRALVASWNTEAGIGNLDPYTALAEARLKRFLAAKPPILAQGLFGVGHVVVTEDRGRAERLGLARSAPVLAEDPELPAWLVEIPHRPRAYLAGALEEVDEAGALAFALSGGRDGVTVLEAPPPIGYAPPRGNARIVEDAPGDTALEVESDGAGLLVLNDARAPGWTARVDGAEIPVVAANYLARGVWVPAGRHRVEFHYATPGLRAGWLIALLAVLFCLGAAAVERRRALEACDPS